MELAEFVVKAVLTGNQGVRQFAKDHGVSKTWLYELLERYREGGEEALKPRSRRPRHVFSQIPLEIEDEIVSLRKQLFEFGVECGPDTIHTHLTRAHKGKPPCSVSTVYRVSRAAASSPPSRTSDRRAPIRDLKPLFRTSAGRWT